jgi:hypothetical protein
MVVDLAAGQIAKFDCARSTTTTPDGVVGYLPSDFSIGIGIGNSADIIPITLPGDELISPASANELRRRFEERLARVTVSDIIKFQLGEETALKCGGEDYYVRVKSPF